MAGERKRGKRNGRRVNLWLVGLTVLAVLLFLAYSQAWRTASSRTSQMSAFDDDWNDLSDLREDLEYQGYEVASVLSSPTLLDTVDDPSSTCFLVAGIERPYSSTEAFALYNFFLDGGKLIVADDFGYMNSLSNFKDPTRPFMVEPTGGRLWDQAYQRNPTFVKVSINDADFFTGTILLNEPSAFTSQGDGEVIARSSTAAWVDRDNDYEHDPDELYGNHVIIRLLRSGIYTGGADDGAAVFISDPSLLINEMYGRLDNRNFTLALLRHLMPPAEGGEPGKGYTIIFDESRHIHEDVVSTAQGAFYDGMVRSTTDRNFRVITGVIALLAVVVLVAASENPRNLKHEQDLGQAKYHHLHDPHFGHPDLERTRGLLRERVRIAYGMDREEFGTKSREELRELVGDDLLADFLLGEGVQPGLQELEAVLLEIEKWG